MTSSHWLDRWQWTDPDSRCHCGHLLRDHPAERFRSCSHCVWCDDFREPPSEWERERADAVQFMDPMPRMRPMAEIRDDYVTCPVCGGAVFAMRFERAEVMQRHNRVHP